MIFSSIPLGVRLNLNDVIINKDIITFTADPMCRLAAYLGPKISLGKFLMQPQHSLYHQSWAPQEMLEAVVNADGFGFGWINPNRETAVYRNVQPIWSDMNLSALVDALYSGYWLANVRSATLMQQPNPANLQPFKMAPLLFAHNGYIKNFNASIRAAFHEALSPSIQAEIQGNTDSEYIFALLRQQLQQNADVAQALVEMIRILETLTKGADILLNLIVGDGERFYALRHAVNGQCPSLYYNVAGDDFPDASLLASEPLTKSDGWQAVPEHTYAMISGNSAPVFVSL